VRRNQSEKKDKKLDDARLLRWWKAWHREERDAVLGGPYAVTLAELFKTFANIECVKPAQLVEFISAIDWSAIDYETRLIVLREVSVAITRYREKRGLEPFDDPLPGASPNAFQVIRGIITELPASSRARPTRRGPIPGQIISDGVKDE
jgi:hypothetical protein